MAPQHMAGLERPSIGIENRGLKFGVLQGHLSTRCSSQNPELRTLNFTLPDLNSEGARPVSRFSQSNAAPRAAP